MDALQKGDHGRQIGTHLSTGGTMPAPKTWTEVRTAKDPEAYVAAFGPNGLFQWGNGTVKVELVEVLRGETPSGRKRFVIRFVEVETGRDACVSCEAIGQTPPMKATRTIAGRRYCFAHGMDIYCD